MCLTMKRIFSKQYETIAIKRPSIEKNRLEYTSRSHNQFSSQSICFTIDTIKGVVLYIRSYSY